MCPQRHLRLEFYFLVFPCQNLDPGALQNGFGVTFGLANFRRIARKFLSEFVSKFVRKFSTLFLQGLTPQENIHAQDSRPKLSALLSKFTFLNPTYFHAEFLLPGEINKSKKPIVHAHHQLQPWAWGREYDKAVSSEDKHFGQ